MERSEKSSVEKIVGEVTKELVKRSDAIVKPIASQLEETIRQLLLTKIVPAAIAEAEHIFMTAVRERLRTEAELIRTTGVVEMKRMHREIEKEELEKAKLYAVPLYKKLLALEKRIRQIEARFVPETEALDCINELNKIVAEINACEEITKFCGVIGSYNLGTWYYTFSQSYSATFDHLAPFIEYIKDTLVAVMPKSDAWVVMREAKI
jgi:hypothetical protein